MFPGKFPEIGNITSTIDDDSEFVVISHPLPVVRHPAPQPIHVHHERVVTCKRGVDEITIGPILGYSGRHKYVRTADVDKDGRSIFTEAK